MVLYNALDLKAGKKVDRNYTGTLTQPVQFLLEEEKDEQWCAHNLDWFERIGLEQVSAKAERFLKNYKLAKGIIDRTDYIVEENNEFGDLIDKLTEENSSALELKFYPIVPTMVDVLCNEFSKRSSKVNIQTVDDLSHNEMLEEKRALIEQNLMQTAQIKIRKKMVELGLEEDSEEGQQMLSAENIKSLPEIEQYFKKDYRNVYEIWANHQMRVDTERFRIDELEQTAFRDMLTVSQEFWHYRMLENDYELELWNPLQVACHKSPTTRYVSNGNWITHHDLMSPADVIDKYGWMMNEDQLLSLQSAHAVHSDRYNLSGLQNDGSFYDATRSHEWNTQGPSLAMRQYQSAHYKTGAGDILDRILSSESDGMLFNNPDLTRVTTVYWKTQRKLFHLTKIDSEGTLVQDVVTEQYKITDKPIYDTTIFKTKSKSNLVFGEHLDPIWINETYGGIKIGPNHSTFVAESNPRGLEPMYLGICGNKPGRVPFQFKGDFTLYGCKLPVEGSIFGDRNGRTVSFVDRAKPFQVGYNMVNNQIADILVDELGTVIVLDQNALPRQSMGEDWGRNNMAKAYVAMKNFQMLPLDTTITNTESSINFQHYQKLDLEQTNRLLSRIQLATYFKQQAFEAVGLNPQRLGQPIATQQTATGIEQAVNASYAQTEHLFAQHSDDLMPRVHQMRTELAQFYQSKNPSVRLQYMTSNDERMVFQMDGTKLLMRDLNIFCTTKINARELLEKFKQIALTNNTTGASIFDLGNIIKTESIAEMNTVLKTIEEKSEKLRQQQMQAEQQAHQQDLELKAQQEQARLQHESAEAEKEREKDLLVAQIRAASTISLDTTGSDYDSYSQEMDRIQKLDEQQTKTNLEREREANRSTLTREKLAIDREAIQMKKDIAEKNLAIARENKNKYDSKKNEPKKK